jgi:ABC-type multidrug transport system ATPase subunit
VSINDQSGVSAGTGGAQHTPVATFDSTGTIRIGRDADNDIVLSDFWVSKRHAEIRKSGDVYQLVDLNSSNGLHYNGRRVPRATLTAGDRFTIGRHEFLFDGVAIYQHDDMGPTSVIADDLTVSIGGNVLLDDVTFALRRGTLLGIVGPSGCGKSTLLKAMTGIRPATQGKLLYDGRDLYQHYSELRYRIGMVPQDDVLHPSLTVRRALRYAASLRFATDVSRKHRTERITEVVDLLGLSSRFKQRIDTLSGGQRKRTSVALELLTEPSLLALDEPTSGLDPALDKEIMRELRLLADRGRTVVVVTHSVLHLDLCDHVLVMCLGGRMGYFGPPDELLGFFGSEDYADVFDKVTNDADRWAQLYRNSDIYRRYVGEVALELAQSDPRPSLPSISSTPRADAVPTPRAADAVPTPGAVDVVPTPRAEAGPASTVDTAGKGTGASATHPDLSAWPGGAVAESGPAVTPVAAQAAVPTANAVPAASAVAAAGPAGAGPATAGTVAAGAVATPVGKTPVGKAPAVAPTVAPAKKTSTVDRRRFADASGKAAAATGGMQDLSMKHRALHPVAPLRQFFTLCLRMISVIFSDRGYSIFLIGLPLALAVLSHTVPGTTGKNHGLGPDPDGYSLEAQRLLVVFVTGAAFMGIAIAIREIVNESTIYRRERAVGLSPSAYIASKLVVLIIIDTIQVTAFVYLSLLGRGGPAQALVLHNPMAEVILAVDLVAITSTVLGLLASALVKTTEQTTPILVVSIMAQLVLSGGLFQITGQKALEIVSWFDPSRWGFAASAATTNLLNFPFTDPLWSHTAGTWWRAILILLVQIAILIAAARFALRRYEPGRG